MNEPEDFYEEYSEWLVKHYPIYNGDDLVRYFERGEGFESFLAERVERG